MPKLIYVKHATEREERLAGLLTQVRDDDTTSYKAFSTAEELADLLEADLAILLAERFDASGHRPGERHVRRRIRRRRGRPPSGASRGGLGRETDLLTLLEWLGGETPAGGHARRRRRDRQDASRDRGRAPRPRTGSTG
jgi:hypothetical protein